MPVFEVCELYLCLRGVVYWGAAKLTRRLQLKNLIHTVSDLVLFC